VPRDDVDASASDEDEDVFSTALEEVGASELEDDDLTVDVTDSLDEAVEVFEFEIYVDEINSEINVVLELALAEEASELEDDERKSVLNDSAEISALEVVEAEFVLEAAVGFSELENDVDTGNSEVNIELVLVWSADAAVVEEEVGFIRVELEITEIDSETLEDDGAAISELEDSDGNPELPVKVELTTAGLLDAVIDSETLLDVTTVLLEVSKLAEPVDSMLDATGVGPKAVVESDCDNGTFVDSKLELVEEEAIFGVEGSDGRTLVEVEISVNSGGGSRLEMTELVSEDKVADSEREFVVRTGEADSELRSSKTGLLEDSRITVTIVVVARLVVLADTESRVLNGSAADEKTELSTTDEEISAGMLLEVNNCALDSCDAGDDGNWLGLSMTDVVG
jgi:hypothetical protein